MLPEVIFFTATMLFTETPTRYIAIFFYVEFLFFAVLIKIILIKKIRILIYRLIFILFGGVLGLCILVKTIEFFNQENQTSFLD